MDCAHFLTGTVEASKSLKISMWAEPGSWGGLSSDLQRLPPGAELCGATHFGEPKDKDKPGFISVFFRSSLYGDDLRKFWAPVLTAAGCTFREDKSFHDQTNFVWMCPHEKGGVVTVITNPGDEFYSIGFMKH